jgi:hypothetical protein
MLIHRELRQEMVVLVKGMYANGSDLYLANECPDLYIPDWAYR